MRARGVTLAVAGAGDRQVEVGVGELGASGDHAVPLDARGVVQEAYASSDSAAAKCYRTAYVGMKVPVPPFSPLPLIVQLQMPGS